MAHRHGAAPAWKRIGAACLAALLVGCAPAPPKLDLRFVRADLAGDNTYLGTRVRERAITLRYAAQMRGLEGRDIFVRVYVNRDGRPELVSQVSWRPDQTATDWQWVPVLVPFSKLLGMWNANFTAVAVSPDAPDGYFDRSDTWVDLYQLYGGLQEGAWGFESFEENASVGADERGVRCSFWFVTRGRQPHAFRAVLHVLNARTVQSMRVPSAWYTVTQGGQAFEHVGFEVRYADIAALVGAVEGDDLIFYPSAEWDDGKRTDNLYVDSYAFGSPTSVIARLEAAHAEAARQARNVEQSLELLRQAER